MRLCLVGDVQSVHVQRFATHFAETHEVHLLTHTPGSCSHAVVHDIGPYVPPTGINHSTIQQLLRTVKRAKRAMKDSHPDIVHGHYLQDSAFFAARSGFHPLVVSAWGSDVLIHPYTSRAYRLMTRYVLKKADKIHSVSKQLTEKLIELGADERKILTVPMGVDIEKFKADREPGKRENVVISTRSLKPVYNVDVLIRSMPSILKHIEDARVVIAGDGELREQLRNAASALDAGDKIQLVGNVDHEAVPALLNSGRVYVSMSSSDGTSASLLEAMACGLFPVVSDIPANRAWIEDGKNGFLVPLDDQDILAKRIVEALEDDDLASEAMRTNIETVRKKAVWQDNMKLIEKAYGQLVEAK
jgi:glycosyltransferase involved in cell wall biosynthesis